AIEYFNQLKKFDSEHKIYCYLRFYDCLTKKNQSMLFDSLKRAVHETLNKDSKHGINTFQSLMIF
ncbi:MAG: hypothetical protein KAH13_02700, partial [Tenericutes bacterium]|nr:hypothetical protein [Mycoplasmatota bacterium]